MRRRRVLNLIIFSSIICNFSSFWSSGYIHSLVLLGCDSTAGLLPRCLHCTTQPLAHLGVPGAPQRPQVPNVVKHLVEGNPGRPQSVAKGQEHQASARADGADVITGAHGAGRRCRLAEEIDDPVSVDPEDAN